MLLRQQKLMTSVAFNLLEYVAAEFGTVYVFSTHRKCIIRLFLCSKVVNENSEALVFHGHYNILSNA